MSSLFVTVCTQQIRTLDGLPLQRKGKQKEGYCLGQFKTQFVLCRRSKHRWNIATGSISGMVWLYFSSSGWQEGIFLDTTFHCDCQMVEGKIPLSVQTKAVVATLSFLRCCDDSMHFTLPHSVLVCKAYVTKVRAFGN